MNNEPHIIPRERLNAVIRDNLRTFATKSIMIHKKNKKVHEYNLGDLVLVIDQRYVDSNHKRTSTKMMQANKRYPWIAKIVAINGRETRLTYDIKYVKQHEPTLEQAKFAPNTSKLSSIYFKPYYGTIKDDTVIAEKEAEVEQNPLDINVSMLIDTSIDNINESQNNDFNMINDGPMIDDVDDQNHTLIIDHGTEPSLEKSQVDNDMEKKKEMIMTNDDEPNATPKKKSNKRKNKSSDELDENPKKKKYKKKAKTQYNTTQIIRSPQPITKIFKRKSKKK